MKNIPRLKGESIDLCTFRQDDGAIERYMEWMNDEDILHFLQRNGTVCQLRDEEEYAKNAGKDGKIHFNIVKGNILIGNCDISISGSNGCVGIVVGEKSERNKGYGTEAVKMLVKFGFEELGLHRICLSLNAENDRAHACYKKAGFKDCGVAHESIWFKNHWGDVVDMEILRSDYENEIGKA